MFQTGSCHRKLNCFFNVREVEYTEPAVKGDTSGKVMKPARLTTGYVLQVPAFVETGDKIEVDTRTGEYRSRVK